MAVDSPEHWRAEVAARLAALDAQDAAGAESRQIVALDQQSVGRLSRMDALQQQAMAQANAARRTQDPAKLNAALARLDEGEFGYCVACGEAIAPARLALDPAIPTCVSCALAR
ncbi:MAG: TraR/DksA C4-type zinc finger protein [Pseudomonadota bacterium]